MYSYLTFDIHDTTFRWDGKFGVLFKCYSLIMGVKANIIRKSIFDGDHAFVFFTLKKGMTKKKTRLTDGNRTHDLSNASRAR